MSKQKEARKAKILEVLNKARAMELQAIGQYMNQHYALDAMDFGELAANMKLIAIDEMRHAEDFAERIKELDGEPTTDMDSPVQKGQNVKQVFTFDTALEDDTVDKYNEFLKVCRENGDSISAKLFEQIIDEEQDHLNYFDSIKMHIDNLGNNFLSRIAGTSSSTGLAHQGFYIRKQGGGDA